MSQAPPAVYHIAPAIGRKAIKRLCKDLETLIDRAPAAHVATWPMDARSAMNRMRAVLERMYADKK